MCADSSHELASRILYGCTRYFVSRNNDGCEKTLNSNLSHKCSRTLSPCIICQDTLTFNTITCIAICLDSNRFATSRTYWPRPPLGKTSRCYIAAPRTESDGSIRFEHISCRIFLAKICHRKISASGQPLITCITHLFLSLDFVSLGLPHDGARDAECQ